MQATIVTLNRTFGFARNAEGIDIFVLFADCKFKLGDCQIGDVVEIDHVTDFGKGPRAYVPDWEINGVRFVSQPNRL